MMTDLISRSAAIDIIDEERRFIESLRETAFDNEDRAHNTGELGCAIRLARKIKALPAIDAVPVVHDIRKLTSFLRVKDVNKWQSRIILDEGEESKNCAVFYREMDSDLVSVVRCKDCRHSDLGYIDSLRFCTEYQSMVSENGFCYKGARMDEKEND